MKNKRIIILMYFCTLAGYILAQTPGFNYQAVLRNDAGEPMTNAELTLHFSLIDVLSNTVIYKENQSLTTDELGIITCMVGAGTAESGTFSEITGVQDLSVKIEAELPGETGITNIGESPIGIVPYALYGRDEDADPNNEMQELILVGDSLKLSGTSGVGLQNIKTPWQYDSDSNSYFLSFSDEAQRDGEKEGIEFKYINGTVVTTHQVNDVSDALFILRDKDKFEDLPLDLRKAYNRMTFFIHEEFGEDISAVELNIDANFSVRENKVRDFKLYVTLGDENNTRIWINTSNFRLLELNYETTKKEITLEGRISEDCGVFEPFGGSVGAFGVTEQFFYADGRRVVFDPEAFANFDFTQDLQETLPAFRVNKDEDQGSTSWSMFSKTENNDCYHVNATLDGVYTLLYGNSPDVIAQLFADDDAGLNLSGNGCGAQANCKNFLLVNDNGKQRSAPFISSQLTSNSDLSGALQLNGDESTNLQMTSLAGHPNNGYFLVLDNQSQNKAGIYINEANEGVVYASNISAVVQEDGSNSTVYGALVGDESAAYTRGTAELIDGEATVICPDHFQNIADPNSMTVTITPLSGASQGVAVVEKFPGGFMVKELANGTGNYQFDYMVSCKRKNQKSFTVHKSMPKAGTINTRFTEEDLRHQTAMELKESAISTKH
ncbi:MAG: hypothetical protein HKN76_04870 [Saprospiraceae bacterium]|nr:hypothetical protein [Saprospiraceae bacterium]